VTEFLREIRTDVDGEYVEVWHTPPPPKGQQYQVLEERWTNNNYAERHIYTIHASGDKP
jgi:hypothetical protein